MGHHTQIDEMHSWIISLRPPPRRHFPRSPPCGDHVSIARTTRHQTDDHTTWADIGCQVYIPAATLELLKFRAVKHRKMARKACRDRTTPSILPSRGCDARELISVRSGFSLTMPATGQPSFSHDNPKQGARQTAQRHRSASSRNIPALAVNKMRASTINVCHGAQQDHDSGVSQSASNQEWEE